MPLAVRIPTPCPASWAAMTPTAAGRHCASCQKTVVDFTQKTDAEILAYLAGTTGEICGRLRADQQNRPLVSTTPVSPAPRWRIWLAATLALWSARESESLGVEARTKPTPTHHSPTKAHAQRHSARTTLLRGTVHDAATGEPLAGVAIFLKGENQTATTDSAGQFSLRLPTGRSAAQQRHLVLHRAGYLSRYVALTPAPDPVHLTLRADPAAAGVEVVAAYKVERTVITGGGLALLVVDEKAPARPRRGLFHWLTRPFRRG